MAAINTITSLLSRTGLYLMKVRKARPDKRWYGAWW